VATRITASGQITVPRHVREALCLAAGDLIEFQLTASGEVVLRKAPADAPAKRRQAERVNPRREAQMRRRAEELLELLRALD
jgi:antitoxin PrlF